MHARKPLTKNGLISYMPSALILTIITMVFVVIDSSLRDENYEKQSIQRLDEAFNRVQVATGNDDINKIVHDFIKQEDTNFALYNYVSLYFTS